jgi:Kef-type K+ transport system membrane component KefB
LILLISCAWVGQASGLTSLLGALWAGILLSRLQGSGERGARSRASDAAMRRTFELITEVFLPLYFISVGMRLPLAALQDSRAWGLAAGITVLALISKAACALGIWRQDVAAGIDRRAVVFGLLLLDRRLMRLAAVAPDPPVAVFGEPNSTREKSS